MIGCAIFVAMLAVGGVLPVSAGQPVQVLSAGARLWPQRARALPADGRLITLEADGKHAEVARRNLSRAGLSDVVELRLGRASETLPRIAAEGAGPFDLIFIDADKPGNAEYFQWALKLSRRGSVIIVDNVVRSGNVIDAGSADANVQGVRRFNEMLAKEKRVSATAMQTVGSKGYDGFAIALVIAD